MTEQAVAAGRVLALGTAVLTVWSLDRNFPLSGFSTAYLGPVLLSYTFSRPSWIWGVSAICIALTMLGLFDVVSQVPVAEHAVLNRSLSSAAIAATALFAVRQVGLRAADQERMNQILELSEQMKAQTERFSHQQEDHQRRARVTLSVMEDVRLERTRLEDEVRRREEVEKHLAKSEQHFRSVVEFAPAAMVMVNGRGEITMLNGEAESLFGYERAELLGLPVETLVPERFRSVDSGRRATFLEDPGASHIGHGRELFALRKDGSELPVEIGLKPIETESETHVLSAFVDISERKRAEEARAKLAAIVESSADAIIGKTLDGFITTWNRGAEMIFGYTSDEAIGMPVAALAVTEQRAKFEQAIDRVEHEEFPEPFDVLGQRKSGGTVELSATVSAVRDPGGRVVGLATIARDISEAKAAEEALRRYADQLRRTNEELDSFAYVASHDLQEPVRNIVSYSSLLEEDLGSELPSEAAQDLRFIVNASRRMQTLVTDLLEFSRTGRTDLSRESVPLRLCADEALESLHQCVLDKGAEVVIDDMPTVEVDRTLIRQVFQNLISNAIKFTNGRSPKVRVSAEESFDGLTCQVSDNGIGIDSEFSSQIFAPFRRLHGRTDYEGTGIGLAICQKVIELHGGRIWVESEKGCGSRFHFTLPRNVDSKRDGEDPLPIAA